MKEDIYKIRQRHKREINEFQDRCHHKKIKVINNAVSIPCCDVCERCGKIVKTSAQYAMED